MPTTVVITSAQTWTAPPTAHAIDAQVEGKGGYGWNGEQDPEVGLAAGGGGGQGGSASVSNYGVEPGWEFNCAFDDDVVFSRGDDRLIGMPGNPGNGPDGGAGGYGACYGFDDGGSAFSGADGQNAGETNGGDGGGSSGTGPGQHGTLSNAPWPGTGNIGGGGRAAGGPGSGPTPGGGGKITITWYPSKHNQGG